MAKLPTETEFALMSFVAIKELSGRQIAKAYEAEFGKQISYGTLYTTFNKMVKSKWVSKRDSKDEDGRVRYFKLTADGEIVFKAKWDYYRKMEGLGTRLAGLSMGLVAS